MSAISFAFMTVLMSGINMFAMALVMKVVLGWDINFSIWVSSLTVAVYVALGGLRSAIFNEVLQFVLIWLGALLIPILGLIEAGGWDGMVRRIARELSGGRTTPTSGARWARFSDNPMGIHWTGIVFGLGLGDLVRLLDDGLPGGAARARGEGPARRPRWPRSSARRSRWWCRSSSSCPGLLGLAVLPDEAGRRGAGALHRAAHSYNEVLPLMLARYCGPGLLGLGITALIAGFMSGMAGNVSAFATVWTYDIYRALIKQGRDRRALRQHGPLVHGDRRAGQHRHGVPGDAVRQHHGLRAGAVQLLHRAAVRHGDARHAVEARDAGGRLLGTAVRAPLSSIAHVGLGEDRPRALRYVALSPHAKDMAENMYRALWSWIDLRGRHRGGQHGDQARSRRANLTAWSTARPKFRPKDTCRCTSGRLLGRCGGGCFRDSAILFSGRSHMHERRNLISIWFFIGVLLLIYGVADSGRRTLSDSKPSGRTALWFSLNCTPNLVGRCFCC